LAFAEQECKAEYLELRRQCQKFAVDLLDQTRSSQELAIILNYDPQSPPYQDGDHMKLKRLEVAIDFKQKKVRVEFRLLSHSCRRKAILTLFPAHRQHSRSSLSLIQTFNSCWRACGTKVSKRNSKIIRLQVTGRRSCGASESWFSSSHTSGFLSTLSSDLSLFKLSAELNFHRENFQVSCGLHQRFCDGNHETQPISANSSNFINSFGLGRSLDA
jgi:hypothetical protein